jgi:hypothetical protein
MRLAFWRKKEPEMPKDFDMSTPDMGGKDSLGLPGAKDDLGLPGAADDLGLPGGGMPDMPEMPGGMDQQTGPEAPQAFPRLEEARPQSPVGPAIPPPAEHGTSGKDLEIISLKLDSMRATLESINERLARLEKKAEGEAESPRF